MAVQTFESKSELVDQASGEAVRESVPSSPSGPASTLRPSRTSRQYSEVNEFDYHPVPVIAVVGMVLAVLSGAGIFIWLAMPLSILAFVVSGLALWMIRRSNGGYGGSGVALGGMFLSVTCLLAGIGFQIYTYQTEVPEGYERLNFVQDISDKKVIMEEGKVSAPPEVAAFDGQKVFLKGYIYQTKETQNLHSFLFVKDNQSCCFGANPEIWDRLGVVMAGDQTINYHAGKVAVAGTFRLNPKFDPNGQLEPIYIITADKFTTRVSDF